MEIKLKELEEKPLRFVNRDTTSTYKEFASTDIYRREHIG